MPAFIAAGTNVFRISLYGLFVFGFGNRYPSGCSFFAAAIACWSSGRLIGAVRHFPPFPQILSCVPSILASLDCRLKASCFRSPLNAISCTRYFIGGFVFSISAISSFIDNTCGVSGWQSFFLNFTGFILCSQYCRYFERYDNSLFIVRLLIGVFVFFVVMSWRILLYSSMICGVICLIFIFWKKGKSCFNAQVKSV